MRTKISTAHPSCFPCYMNIHTHVQSMVFSLSLLQLWLSRSLGEPALFFPRKRKKRRNYVKDRCLSPLSLSLSLCQWDTLYLPRLCWRLSSPEKRAVAAATHILHLRRSCPAWCPVTNAALDWVKVLALLTGGRMWIFLTLQYIREIEARAKKKNSFRTSRKKKREETQEMRSACPLAGKKKRRRRRRRRNQ